METWITSDVHLGARQCRAGWFCAFLDHVPADVRLVLNGDVMTRLTRKRVLSGEHAAALERLRALSLRQEVIWIAGNHDRHFHLNGQHKIFFMKELRIGKLLFVAHGDRFDHLSCPLRVILLPFRFGYEFFTRVIGSQTHVAEFAKRFPVMYEILNGHVVRNATLFAHRQGFDSVTCGHTHHPGKCMENSVSYFNTGCWTEASAHVLICGDQGTLRLCPVLPDGGLSCALE
jgi:UDP-2,3-diacylglucosamine pyrophosphatase LpxH